jgi:hypothetical protein
MMAATGAPPGAGAAPTTAAAAAPTAAPAATPAVASAPGVPPSWMTDLDAYLASSACPFPDPAAAARAALVAAVKAAPSSPEPWNALLSSEEAAGAGGLTGALTGGLGPLSGAGAAGGAVITLYHLYFWATQLVPRARHQAKEEYVTLWMGYARQQWCVRGGGGARGGGRAARAF